MEPISKRDTKIITVDPDNFRDEELVAAAEAARAGEPVVFPTDTVYGVGASALVPGAAAEIYRVKERPADKPLILLIAEPKDVEPYVLGLDERARKLMELFWPGPLTLIFKKSGAVPDEVTAGSETVGVRCPNSPVARALVRLSGVALATTSANIAGHPSPKDAIQARDELFGRVAYIIDAGPSVIGVESTVLDISGAAPRVLREGALSWAEIQRAMISGKYFR